MKGNERANTLAKLDTANRTTAPTPLAHILVTSCVLNEVKGLTREHWADNYRSAKGGNHAGDLNRVLPGFHTKTPYDHLVVKNGNSSSHEDRKMQVEILPTRSRGR